MSEQAVTQCRIISQCSNSLREQRFPSGFRFLSKSVGVKPHCEQGPQSLECVFFWGGGTSYDTYIRDYIGIMVLYTWASMVLNTWASLSLRLNWLGLSATMIQYVQYF